MNTLKTAKSREGARALARFNVRIVEQPGMSRAALVATLKRTEVRAPGAMR
jgi:hypothetical protein